MIGGLSVCDGEVWADEVEVDEEELIDDLMSIIEVMFDTFIEMNEARNLRSL